MRAHIDGIATKMNTFSFFFDITLSQLLFVHTDNLSKTLKGTSISASEGQAVASMTVKVLVKIRDSDSFQLFWKAVTTKAMKLGIGELELPRRRRVPRRFEMGIAEAEFPSTPEEHYRRIYFEALDLVVACIQERFDQPGYRTYSKLESLVLKAAQSCTYEEELTFVLDTYSSDFNASSLKMQLEIFATDFTTTSSPVTLADIVTYAKGLTPSQKELISEVCTLLKLILVIPATNAVSERTFSTLRRVKSYLRSTMSQSRLNHLILLKVHSQLTDQLDLIDVANSFVAGSEHRLSLFGKFN